MNRPPKKPRNFKTIFFAAVVLVLVGLNIGYASFSEATKKTVDLTSPNLKETGLQVKSIDTQIVSKNWGKVDPDNIRLEVQKDRALGVNYLAISTPYDHPDIMKAWADEIHAQGLNVWFRSHWLSWEGDENHASTMSIKDYLDKTAAFVEANPALFRAGDAFTFCVEPEQVFTARGTDVYDWYTYNKFVVDQVDRADESFAAIGLASKIHTNWISMNGWVVENALEQTTVDKLGLITVDHYSNEKIIVPPAALAETLSTDLDRFYQKWQKPILIGEWGYNIEQEVPDIDQREVMAEVTKMIHTKSYIVGLNYWADMGNSSRILDDNYGVDLKYRPAAIVLRDFYNQKQ